MASIAQEQYAILLEEENKKYSGLTAYERKRMILQELKESNGGSGSSARETRPGSSNQAMSSNFSASDTKHNKKLTTAPSSVQKNKSAAPKKKAIRKEWNFEIEIKTEEKDGEVDHFETVENDLKVQQSSI